MKREDLKVGTEVFVKSFNSYIKAVVIEPTRELRTPESIMIRVPITIENEGEKMFDMETFPELVHSYEEIMVNAPNEKKPRIYISGPISGHDIEERRRAFQEVEWMLDAQGYEVVNPMKNGLPSDATTHEHMRRDIELLMTCDYIYLMKKWTHSKGCMVELEVATSIGMPVMLEESQEIIKFI